MRDVSSANSTMSQVPLTWCGRSFIYTRNNEGTKIEPRGTRIKERLQRCFLLIDNRQVRLWLSKGGRLFIAALKWWEVVGGDEYLLGIGISISASTHNCRAIGMAYSGNTSSWGKAAGLARVA
ncbi:jg16917 [Pararge aegeria aegeria]|uniref:Jg16917 protein n=1 Tax=Pararge aegeria aegeria TaxID=348720 RepID=A0A8S4SGG7_9NEOP|nr:jg16917 [Pararge aegeria aegeria]